MRTAILLLILTATLSAASVQFNALPLNTNFGTYNGFAVATVDGLGGQFLVCDDYGHTTYMPSGPLSYTVSTLAGPAPLEHARFANPLDWDVSIARYEQAALLIHGLLHTGPGDLMDLTAEYQYALWHLFEPNVTLPNSTAGLLFDETAEAIGIPSIANIDIFSRLLIYTPTSGFESNQEFLALASEPLTWPNGPPLLPPGSQPIPEPSAWTMMSIGIALAMLGAGSRKLRVLARARSATTSNIPRESEP